jgi:predicted negative regulator of RcsB-dependent stress response
MASKNDQPPADDRVYEVGSFEAELFWEKNRSILLICAGVVLALAAAFAIWLLMAHSARQAAATLFAAANDPAGWREVIAKYPDSVAAADAYFLLADSLREEGKIEESSAQYQKILTGFPKSPLVGGARLGLAENLAVAGKSDEALITLREVREKDSGSYAAPFAALLEGRILVRNGKFEEARKVFTNLVSTYPRSPAARTAGAQLDGIVPFLPQATQETEQETDQ